MKPNRHEILTRGPPPDIYGGLYFIFILQSHIAVEGKLKERRQMIEDTIQINETIKSRIVFVIERAKDQNLVAELGKVATVSPFSLSCWDDEASKTLKQRDVVIIPDKYWNGHKHAEDAARSLQDTARKIRIINLPGLTYKGDVSDWLENDNSVDDLLQLVERTPVWDSANKIDKNLKGAKRLIKIFDFTDSELFHDESSVPYAAIWIDHKRRVVPLESREFTNYLRKIAYEDDEFVPSKYVLDTCIEHYKSKAQFDGDKHALHVRYAKINDAVWIDLDGSAAVEVTGNGWTIQETPPLIFRTYEHHEPLPEPIKGGSVWDLFKFINLQDHADQLLFLSYMISSMIPDMRSPALVLHGSEGSGKSSAMEVIKKLIDPDETAVNQASQISIRDFLIGCSQSRIYFLDNVSKISDKFSDVLCIAVYGGAVQTRALYSEYGLATMKFRALVGFNGINIVARRPDLLDRSLLIELRRIDSQNYLETREFDKEFEESKGAIFGALLDLLVKVLKCRDSVELVKRSRMADFARIGAAVAISTDHEQAEFEAAYERCIETQKEAVLEINSLAEAVIIACRYKKIIRQSPADLFKLLKGIAIRNELSMDSGSFPKAHNRLWQDLVSIRRVLAEHGITIDRPPRDNDGRCIILQNANFRSDELIFEMDSIIFDSPIVNSNSKN